MVVAPEQTPTKTALPESFQTALALNDPRHPESVGRRWDPETGEQEPVWLDREQAGEFLRYSTDWFCDTFHPYGTTTQNDHSRQYETETLPRGEGYTATKYTRSWGAIDEATVRAAGVSVEIAGPSEARTQSPLPTFKPDYVSNIADPSQSTVKNAARGGVAVGAVDLIADARRVPFITGSVGSVKVSCLSDTGQLPEEIAARHNPLFKGLRAAAIQEAARAVKPGGYLIWEAGRSDDVRNIIAAGFTPIAARAITYLVQNESHPGMYTGPTLAIDGVFQKSAQPSEAGGGFQWFKPANA